MTLLGGLIKALPKKIAFKGGTCAMLFYDLPRFSFDLDFDIVGRMEGADVDAAKAVLSKNGDIMEQQDKRFTLFFLFNYGKGYPNIKVEFNKRIWKNNSYVNEHFLGIPLVVQDASTVVTNKLVALTDRRSAVARDLFDVWYLLTKGFRAKPELVLERTSMTLEEYSSHAAKFIKKTFNRRNILQGLGETLDEGQKAWARDNLIAEAVKEIGKIA